MKIALDHMDPRKISRLNNMGNDRNSHLNEKIHLPIVGKYSGNFPERFFPFCCQGTHDFVAYLSFKVKYEFILASDEDDRRREGLHSFGIISLGWEPINREIGNLHHSTMTSDAD